MNSPVNAPIKDPMYVDGVMSRSWVRYFNDISTVQPIHYVRETVTLSDYYPVIFCDSSSDITVTLPSVSSISNMSILFFNIGTGSVTLGGTVYGTLTGALAQYEKRSILSDGTKLYAY